jgi:hypothetical protein
LKITLEGRKKLEAKMAKARRDVKSSVNRAVAEVGEDLLAKTMPKTPLSDHMGGELRGTGYVDHPRPGTALVGFGARYAGFVHEMGVAVYPERAPINWTTPGTGAKFLTGTLNENRALYGSHIKNAARRALDG